MTFMRRKLLVKMSNVPKQCKEGEHDYHVSQRISWTGRYESEKSWKKVHESQMVVVCSRCLDVKRVGYKN